MAELSWYVRRLRSMPMRELPWRVENAARGLVPAGDDRFGELSSSIGSSDWEHALARFRAGIDRPILLDRRCASGIAARVPASVLALTRSADQVMNYAFTYFGYPEVRLPLPVDWNFDPIANVRWPDATAARINHRAASGDVKWIWELNRLQHLPWLAQSWLFTNDSRYSAAAFEQLDSWIEQNPVGRGIAWRGAFEAGIRAISIAVALQGLRDAAELTARRYQRIVRVLASSAGRCWRDRSRFSSANNHLIGEMAGLATVAMMLPELACAPQWESDAVRVLCVEADKQILPDGSSAERSLSYQLFTAELLHLVASMLTQRDGQAPTPITAAISRSCTYLTAVVGEGDPDPRYGDGDDGFALRLGPERTRSVRDHLSIVSQYDRCRFEAGTAGANLDANWFHAVARPPDTNSPRTNPGSATTTATNHFAPDGGFVVLRTGSHRVTMNVGPLGYLSVAAHGHADALAITISSDGADLISDPGTGSYYGNSQWRSVMRGTSAHPTVCVDGEDQSVSGGLFLWTKHAHTRVRGVDLAAGIVDAEHDGYTRLNGEVIHRRWLIAAPGDRTILVIDSVSGDGVHDVRVCWPLHPELDVRRIDGGHTVHRGDRQVLQLRYAGTKATVHDETRADSAQNIGWWSDRLESRTPAWWLGASCVDETPLVIATLLTLADGVQASDLQVRSSGGCIEASWTEANTIRSATIDTAESAAVRLHRMDTSASGRS
ncbi:MAG: alginate lyase family protein [Mycobacterium sp.]